MSREVQLSFSSASKDQLKTKDKNTIHIKIGNLFTSALLTVVIKMAIEVLLGTVFVDEHVGVVLPDEQKVLGRKRCPLAIVKQHNVFANTVFTDENTQNADIKDSF